MNGHYNPPHSMVNNRHLPNGQPFCNAPPLPTPPPGPVFSGPYIVMIPVKVPSPYHQQHYPPTSNQYLQQGEKSTKKSHDITIKDPITGKVLTKNDLQKQNASSLRENAPPFVPSHKFATNDPHSNDSSTIKNTSNVELKDSSETLEADDEWLEESFPNDINTSITEGIRQIPSKLEQQLNQEIEKIEEICQKNSIQPHFPSDHESSSLPHSYPQDSFRKSIHVPFSNRQHRDSYQHRYHSNNRNNGQNHGFTNQFGHQNAPKRFERKDKHGIYSDDQKLFSKYGEHSNIHGSYYIQKHAHGGYSKTYNNHNSQDHWNSSPNISIAQKPKTYREQVDQECTAYPVKDENNNYVTSENDTTKELKDLAYDLNNNEIVDEISKDTDLEFTAESTAEKSEGSLSLEKRRYSKDELYKMQDSPLVLIPDLPEDCEILYKHNSSDLQQSSSFNKSGNSKKMNNSRYENHHGTLTRSKSNEKSMITLNLSLNQDVKLNEAENAWKPSHMKKDFDLSKEERELEKLVKNFRSLLNKLTEENFDHLVNEVNDKRKYRIDRQEKLSKIVELLFEKSISEPGYASIYAKLCKRLSDVHVFSNVEIERQPTVQNPWKRYLITRCQQEFERSQRDDIIFKDIQDRIKNTTDAGEIEQLEDCYFKIRQRANGTVKFIGELYKLNMISAKIMKNCVEGLLLSVTEENIERLCKLLTTIGEKLEGDLRTESLTTKSKPGQIMNKYMQDLEKLKNSNVITTLRIKFDIMNVIDLRLANWKQRINARSSETNPQKLHQIQQEEEKKRKIQQAQLNDYQGRHQSKSSHNLSSRHKSQQMYDNDGFRMSSSARHFDINKINIPKKSNDDELTLGPQKHLYQNFNKSMPQTIPPPTIIRNTFENLSTDCDDLEEIPSIHHIRSGCSNKSNRKESKNNFKNDVNNNSGSRPNANHVIKEGSSLISRSSSFDTEEFDDFFFIELTAQEEKNKDLFVEKMKQIYKGKLTLDMLMVDLKRIKISENVLGCVYNELYDKKLDERMVFVEILTNLCKNGLITEYLNNEALKLSLKTIPSIICDVPHAYNYFAEYCVNFIQSGLLTMNKLENMCLNQQNVFDKVKEKLQFEEKSITSGESECFESRECPESEEFSFMSESLLTKVKEERCLNKLMDTIHYKLCKKNKKNDHILEEIYSLIDGENCQDVKNFIKNLTITLLKACFEPKYQKKKIIDLAKLFPIWIRYIDNDILLQIECADAIFEFSSGNPKSNNHKLCNLFDLFYDNDVIGADAFKQWKEDPNISKEKLAAIENASSFFLKLDEHDLFNCTSSTTKD